MPPIDDLKNLINLHDRRLQILKQQQASFGPLHTPAHILIEIEDTEIELKELMMELNLLDQGKDKNEPVTTPPEDDHASAISDSESEKQQESKILAPSSPQKFTINGSEVDALPQGTVLEQFRIDSFLAHGGMGAIYRGRHVRTEQAVAIKENFITTTEGIAQFQREGEILVKLGKHPHLPLVYDYFIIGKRQYLVMEFIEGLDLSEMTKTAQGRKTLPIAKALNIIIQVCEAVTHLHSQKPLILHRDIKPQNIKVSSAGVAVLVDFGLAKMDGHDSETQVGAQGLTFGFAPPEQYTGATRTQPASDIYALAATLYAVLTAKRPPDSLRLTLGDIAFEPPHHINPAVPLRLSQAIEQAMKPRPSDRPQSAAEWQTELKSILTELNSSEQEQGASIMPTSTPSPEPAEQPQGQDVFISYSRKDETFIKQLYQELTGSGLSSWYDRLNIGVGKQWASEIVTGIRDCKVFVLVLSPGSAASPNVRKEVDLAQRYDKQIVPLIWQPTQIPVAMEYQLAGIQWIEFNGSTAPEKFSQLSNVLKNLIGGASMAEATSDAAIAKESNIAPIPAEMPEVAPTGSAQPRRLNRFKKVEPKINPVVLGSMVISGVVTAFGLQVEQQDFVDEELKWLFNAIAHMFAIKNGQVEATIPVPVTLPPDVIRKDPAANNQVLPSAVALPQSSAFMNNLETLLNKRLKEQLDILNNQLLPRATQLGEAVATDAALQADLKGRRISIVELLVELARTVSQVYGVYVASPEELLETIRGD